MRSTRLAGAGVVLTAAAVVLPVSVPSAAVAETPRPAAVAAATSKATPAESAVPTKRPLTKAQLAKKRAAAAKKRAAAAKRARHLRAVRHNRWLKVVRFKLVKMALSRVGRGQYVAGASGPWTFDCSGFTKYVYRATTGIVLPHYSGSQLHYPRGHRVTLSQLQPGDLMAWGSNGSQHVSMYIGRGLMIGANNPRRDVVVESINSSYWAPRFAGARRVIV